MTDVFIRERRGRFRDRDTKTHTWEKGCMEMEARVGAMPLEAEKGPPAPQHQRLGEGLNRFSL